MRPRRRGYGALLAVLLMALPAWAPVAAADVATPDAIGRLLQDLQAGAEDAEQLAGDFAPPGLAGVPTPAPGAAVDQANATEGELQEQVQLVEKGPLRTLFREGFERGSLASLGWGQEVLNGDAPWGIVNARDRTVRRADQVFTPEFETAQVPIVVKDGRHAATLLNAKGVYDRLTDARLISPVIDLRYVEGAAARTDDAYLRVMSDPALQGPFQQFLALYAITPVHETKWLFTTPPSQVHRLFLGRDPNLQGVPGPCLSASPSGQGGGQGGLGGLFNVLNPDITASTCPLVNSFVNPLADRYGAGLVNLTFYHQYDFKEDLSDIPGARRDGAFLEVRIVHDDNTTEPWQYLFGDTIFEPNVNDPGTVGSLVGQLPSASGLAENTQGTLTDSDEFNAGILGSGGASHYNGRVQVRAPPPDGCKESDVSCVTSVPAFVVNSRRMLKSHFTLNAFVGERIQLAWRAHSGLATVGQHSGWFLDAVKVEALLPGRDVGVEGVEQPRLRDVVPTDALIQPSAVIKNYGFLPMESLLVNFTIEQDLPTLTPEAASAALAADAAALAGTTVPPGDPPGATEGLAASQTQTPQVVLRSSTTIARLDGLESVVVKSPVPCLACTPGAWRLRVEVTPQTFGGGAPGELPVDRVEDGTASNNLLVVPFQVRDVPGAELRLLVPANSVLTDLNEPKTLLLTLTNTGNRPLTGGIDLSALAVDLTTLEPLPGGAPIPVGGVFVGPSDLPAGKRLTSYGGDRDTFEAALVWTPPGLPPGAYRVTATFRPTPAVTPLPAASASVFIRATPTAYYEQDFEPHAVGDGFTRDRLPHVDFDAAGWKGEFKPLSPTLEGFSPVPDGPVSTNHTWNATGYDGVLLEAAVLNFLARANPGGVAAPGLVLPPNNVSLEALPGLPGGLPDITLSTEEGRVTIGPVEVIERSGAGSKGHVRVPIKIHLPAPTLSIHGEVEGQRVDLVLPEPGTVPADIDLTQEMDIPGIPVNAPVKLHADRILVVPPRMTLSYFRPTIGSPYGIVDVTPGRVFVQNLTLNTPQGTTPFPVPIDVGTPPVNGQKTCLLGSSGCITIPQNLHGFQFPTAGAVPDQDLRDQSAPPATLNITTPGDTRVISGGSVGTDNLGIPTVIELGFVRENLTEAGVPIANQTLFPSEATVRFGAANFTVCAQAPVGTPQCQTYAYDILEQNLAQDFGTPVQPYQQHALLHDEYLGQEIDLRNSTCTSPCRPVLTFWHRGNFSWGGVPEPGVSLPGAVGGPAHVPGSIQGVSPDQLQENRTRGMVEVTVLDGGASVRTQLPIEDARDLADAPGLCETLAGAPEDACAKACVGAPGIGAGAVPLLNQWYDETLSGRPGCVLRTAEDPLTASQALATYTTPVSQWRRERIDLGAFAGRQIHIDFHFQTPVGRVQTEAPKSFCTLHDVNEELPSDVALPRCLGTRSEHWVLDNIRLLGEMPDGTLREFAADCQVTDVVPAKPKACGFFDTVGDKLTPDEGPNLNASRWTRFETLRSVLDADATLPPDCFFAAETFVNASQPASSVDAAATAAATKCFEGAGLHAPSAYIFDGRGWQLFTHDASLPGSTAESNPYYDGWFLDDTAGFRSSGTVEAGRATGLRFGGPGQGGSYPGGPNYSYASTPLLSLARSSHPVAAFLTNYTFFPDYLGVSERRGIEENQLAAGVDASRISRDGGAVFLARYAPDPSTGRYVLDRRVLLQPQGGYPGLVTNSNDTVGSSVHGMMVVADPRYTADWNATDGAGKRIANAFVGSSNGYRAVSVDLLAGFQALCLKKITLGGETTTRSYAPGVRPGGEEGCGSANFTAGDYVCSGGTCFDGVTGATYVNLTEPTQDALALYALEFHANNDGVHGNEGYGWAIDDLRVREQFLANDVAISRLLEPLPGRFVGPGEQVQVRLNVTNEGFFPQRGLVLHFRVLQEGVQVFPEPDPAKPRPPGCSVSDCAQVTPQSLVFPGGRDPKADRNVTVSLETPWTPEGPGVYVLEAWTELVGDRVGGQFFPLLDEDPRNDRFAQVVDVREVHDVRLLPPSALPDAEVVLPLVGSAADVRAVRIAVENVGTMEEGDLGGLRPERGLVVQLAIQDENGDVVLEAEQPVARLAAGRQGVADFGATAWKPEGGGLYTLHFRAVLNGSASTAEDARTVRVLVLSPLVPRDGQAWQDAFAPHGGGWSNQSRASFDAGQGWSFGQGDGYQPEEGGTLDLLSAVDVTTFRGAVLSLQHRYDFELGYDGGVVEVSTDGVNWTALAPLGGYPGNLTSASPDVARPGDVREAFTGVSDGVVTSIFPLGSIAASTTPPVPLFWDTFDHGTRLQGAELTDITGRWVEVVERQAPPADADGSPAKAWWVSKDLVYKPLPALDSGRPLSENTSLDGYKELRNLRPAAIPGIEGNLLVEFDEWRALGLSVRAGDLPYLLPTSAEVFLERLDAAGKVVATVPVVGRGVTPYVPYSDNYIDWSHRAVLLPGTASEQFAGQSARLVFRMNLANSNIHAVYDGTTYDPTMIIQPQLNQPAAAQNNVTVCPCTHAGTGLPEDTDLVSSHLGWAVAHPRISLVTTRAACESANLRYENGRCIVFDDPLDYGSADGADAKAAWAAAWHTERRQAYTSTVTLVGELNSTDDAVKGSDALVDAGWKLVDKVGDVVGKPVWNTRAVAPPRSGHGRVAEATGEGVDARLVTPLNLRAASGDVDLSFDHSFKFSDLYVESRGQGMRGGASGGRVEVSRDGGQTWEPLVPNVGIELPQAQRANPPCATRPSDACNFTRNLEAVHFHHTFAPPSSVCAAGLYACIDPARPFDAPSGWAGDGLEHPWTPEVASSAHTPFAGSRLDPEGDSRFGIGSAAFSGSTCTVSNDATGFRPVFDAATCEGLAGWQRVTFDLSPYAGEEVLLGFRASFASHRYVGGFQNATTNVTPDFWRIDGIRVDAPVLDGRPLHLRLRAFSDATGERYGWDIVNATLLGDEHLLNLGVRVEAPGEGQPLPPDAVARASVVNKGQQTVDAAGSMWVEQVGAPALVNGGFEQRFKSSTGEVNDPCAVNPGTAVATDCNKARPGWNLTVDDATQKRQGMSKRPAAGDLAVSLQSDGGPSDPFTLKQTVEVPAGHWALQGRYAYREVQGQARFEVRDADNVLLAAFDPEPQAEDFGTDLARAAWQGFVVPFDVQGEVEPVTFRFTTVAPGGAIKRFSGTLLLDDLSLQPLPDPTAAQLLGNPGFEDGLANWTITPLENATLATFADNGAGIAHDGSASAIPEGRQALILAGSEGGPGDFEVAQSLTLEPGRYRLTGLYASLLRAGVPDPVSHLRFVGPGRTADTYADVRDGTAPTVWQVVTLPAGAERVETLQVELRLPDAVGGATGKVAAQLFATDGTPLSEEAFVAFDEAVATEAVVADFTFRRGFLPAGTQQVVVGLRGVGLDPHETTRLGVGVRFDSDFTDGFLAQRGSTGFAPATGERLDLGLVLGLRETGRVTLDVEGAEATPLDLTQPGPGAAFLTADTFGAHPFSLDFVVPSQSPVTVRLRAVGWEGQSILDGLRLQRISVAAASLRAAGLGAGASAAQELPFDAVEGAAYRVFAGVRLAGSQGEGVAGESLLGDNYATATSGVTLGVGRLAIVGLAAEPNNVNLTEGGNVALLLKLQNPGATETDVREAVVTITSPDGFETIYRATQADLDPLPEAGLTVPGQSETLLQWQFRPDPTSPAGTYRISARVEGTDGAPAQTAKAQLYLGSDFHSQFGFGWPFFNVTTVDELETPTGDEINVAETQRIDLWTSNGALDTLDRSQTPAAPCPEVTPGPNGQPPAGGDPCNPNFTAEEVTGGLGWMWHKTSALNLSASRAVTIGGDENFTVAWPAGRPGPGGDTPPPRWGTMYAALRTPAINITHMAQPHVIFAEKRSFGPGVVGEVFARLLNGTALFPDTTHSCISLGGPAWVNLGVDYRGETTGYKQNKWVSKNVDIFAPLKAAWDLDQAKKVAAGAQAARQDFDLDAWKQVQVCWRVTHFLPATLGAMALKEWSIDDVLVTPYAMSLGPEQRGPITDNVTKDFKVLLRNDGAYTDTYLVAAKDETGQPSRVPSFWSVDIVDTDGRPLREVRLQPGEERLVVARVRLGVAPATVAREGTIDLPLSVSSVTSDVLRSTVHLLFDFTYPERPNLRATGVIVNDAALSVDKPRTVDVLVQNTGTQAVRDVGLQVVDKMDASFGVAPEDLRLLDGKPIPLLSLQPGEVQVVTVNWVPHVPGEHNLTVLIDPLGRLIESDERDNVLIKPIEVGRAEFPDLHVDASVSNDNPMPGDQVEVKARIANLGGAPALGVKLSLTAGVTDLLPGESPHLLPKGLDPGESVEVNATWRPAFPGEQVILVRATTLAGILESPATKDDNVVVLPVKVRSRGLEVSAPAGLLAKPGETTNITLLVTNRGDLDDTYRLTVDPPEGWRADLRLNRLGQLPLGNHSSANVTLLVGPPPQAESGPFEVLVRAASENGTDAVATAVVVTIPQAYGLRFSVEPEQLLQPGKRLLPVTLENSGNGPDLVTVRAAKLPEGWSLDPATFEVKPRATANVRLNLTLPGSTPEGAYPVRLEAQGKGGALLAQDALVQVLPWEMLTLHLQDIPAVVAPGQQLEGKAIVANDGNVAARATLNLSAPEGWKVRLERDLVSLQPGERRTLAVGLVVPMNASAEERAVRLQALSGTAQTYQLRAPVRVAHADLLIAEVDVQPRGQVRDGATVTVNVKVQNRGELPALGSVAVYVDDKLLAFEPGATLAPGEEAKVTAAFRAKGGEHVLLVATDPAKQVGEEDEANNARVLVQHVDRGGAFFAVPGFEVLALVGAAFVVATALRRRGMGR